MRSSIHVSAKLRQRLARRKTHARQSYEEVIAGALAAAEARAGPVGASFPSRVAEVLGEFKRALAGLYGERLVRLVLYGSHARGDAHPDSDVDVLVVLAGDLDRAREMDRIVHVTYDLLLARGVHLSALPMAERDYLTAATPLLINVRREGIPL